MEFGGAGGGRDEASAEKPPPALRAGVGAQDSGMGAPHVTPLDRLREGSVIQIPRPEATR